MRRSSRVSLVLFGSGLCALIYQTVWLREFRLIFGASTAASAAVLAIFMGGLGAGGIVLGKRADRQDNPLAFYARLEGAIALSAALTPLLIWLVRQVYVTLGGSAALGLPVGTAVRLLLSTLVLLVPTFLMGGTLPAAARAVETDADASRHDFALLYGANTLGAVVGVMVSTFSLLELLGNRRTLWVACLINALVALAARAMSRTALFSTSPDQAAKDLAAASTSRSPEGSSPGLEERRVPASFVLAAAAIVGFAFLLMELVWYRMLGPLLGGSSFTFGIILAVALTGIGVGGALYSLLGKNESPSPLGFALTCALEALFMAIPFALGDRIAILTLLLRPLGSTGFAGYVAGWTIVTSLVVFPAALVAGVQFPMLIGLLGRGREDVGRHIGLAYAWNTAGAIAGSLAGGFGLLPLLYATGSWRAVIVLLALLSLAAVLMARPLTRRIRSMMTPVAASLLAIALLFTTGPTAAWRHSPIGVGRIEEPKHDANDLRRFLNVQRSNVEWEEEGVESSVALVRNHGYAFVVNGKSDGHARMDAGTQVMAPLIGAILHPGIRRAMVIGLGTGSTAGWLGSIPSVERVDVVELEPAILKVAAACTPVNREVLKNPKAHITIGDAREFLITTRSRYDLIFSEPSNPYRAGIASLFTREYYRAARHRLNDGGLFLQWLQAYEVDAETIRTVFATLAAEFPVVETWQTTAGDLLLVGALRPVSYDPVTLASRIRQEPFRSALKNAWSVTDLHGFLAHYVANDSLTRALAREWTAINTDDRNYVEFGFARSLATSTRFSPTEVWKLARSRRQNRPALGDASFNWALVDEMRLASFPEESEPSLLESKDPEMMIRAAARVSYKTGDLPSTLSHWRRQNRGPSDMRDLEMLAEVLADAGDAQAGRYIAAVRGLQPSEAEALMGRLLWRQGKAEEAARAVETALLLYRHDPWPSVQIMFRSLDLALTLARSDSSHATALRFYRLLEKPFVLAMFDQDRRRHLWELSRILDAKRPGNFMLGALRAHEPHVPWEEEFLRARASVYRELDHPLAGRATAELFEFLEHEPVALGAGLK